MKFVRAILLAAGVVGGSSFLLLAIASFIVAKSGVLPQGALPLVTTAIASAAAFLGGVAAALAAKEKGLYLGLAAGALLAVCMGVAAYFSSDGVLAVSGIGKAAAVLTAGAIGGILGANRKQKVKF